MKKRLDKTFASMEASSGTQYKGSSRHGEQRNLWGLKGRGILG